MTTNGSFGLGDAADAAGATERAAACLWMWGARAFLAARLARRAPTGALLGGEETRRLSDSRCRAEYGQEEQPDDTKLWTKPEEVSASVRLNEGILCDFPPLLRLSSLWSLKSRVSLKR